MHNLSYQTEHKLNQTHINHGWIPLRHIGCQMCELSDEATMHLTVSVSLTYTQQLPPHISSWLCRSSCHRRVCISSRSSRSTPRCTGRDLRASLPSSRSQPPRLRSRGGGVRVVRFVRTVQGSLTRPRYMTYLSVKRSKGGGMKTYQRP